MILLMLAALDGTIEEHLRALREDDPDRRQSAATSLIVLGEAGLDAVRAARAEAVDSETRARLTEIEARIEADVRRRTFPGGPVVAGLKAALDVRWDPDRDAVQFSMTVMNVDARDRWLVELEGWEIELPRWSESTSWSRLTLEVRAVHVDPDGQSGVGARHVSSCGRRFPPPLLRLAPGEARTSEALELPRGTHALALRPGAYEARAVHPARKYLPDADADLATPWRRFEVPRP